MLLDVKTLLRTNPPGRGLSPRVIVLQCDICGSIYERKYSAHYFAEAVNRCSLECAYGSRRTDGLGGHGGAVISYTCDGCGDQCKRQATSDSSTGKRGRFCSSKCYGTWLTANPEAYASSLEALHSPGSRERARLTRNRRLASGEIVHSWVGRHHTEETKRAISRHHIESGCLNGAKNGMWGKNHTGAAREKMSDAVSKRILDGNHKPYGTRNVKGHYVSIRDGKERFFRSAWERGTMQWLDLSPNVAAWDYECVRIPYRYADHRRWYVPDFLVTFRDGRREMWEVKPKEFIDTEKNKLKTEAARAFCDREGISEYKLLTGDELREMKVMPGKRCDQRYAATLGAT